MNLRKDSRGLTGPIDLTSTPRGEKTCTFGFLGLGNMGSAFVMNCIAKDHKVLVWNRTHSKCWPFEKMGAQAANTPRQLIARVDIAFSCVADPVAAKQIVFGKCGILSAYGIRHVGKGYVEMSGIDDGTSKQIGAAMMANGTRYLEAMIQGSKEDADRGKLVIFAAGDLSLFLECQPCFKTTCENVLYLGQEVGRAAQMYIALQAISGIVLSGLAEGLALAQRSGIKLEDFLVVLELTNLVSPFVLSKTRAMLLNDFKPDHKLKNVQKDLGLAMDMSENLMHPMPATSRAYQQFSAAQVLRYGDEDSSAIIKLNLS